MAAVFKTVLTSSAQDVFASINYEKKKQERRKYSSLGTTFCLDFLGLQHALSPRDLYYFACLYNESQASGPAPECLGMLSVAPFKSTGVMMSSTITYRMTSRVGLGVSREKGIWHCNTIIKERLKLTRFERNVGFYGVKTSKHQMLRHHFPYINKRLFFF